MSENLPVAAASRTFESIKRTNQSGAEFWSARDLARVLEYLNFRNFEPVLERAREACTKSGHLVADHIAQLRNMVGHQVATLGARLAGALQHRLEIAEVQILQHTGQVAGGPEFRPRLVGALNRFEGAARGRDRQVFAHDEAGLRMNRTWPRPAFHTGSRIEIALPRKPRFGVKPGRAGALVSRRLGEGCSRRAAV